jgi:hypothetical protein
MTPITVIPCLLCDWAYQVKPLDSRLNSDTLAGVFGPGIMLQTALNRQAEETERELEAHLKTHALVEWVKKVTAQQQEIARCRQEHLEDLDRMERASEAIEKLNAELNQRAGMETFPDHICRHGHPDRTCRECFPLNR